MSNKDEELNEITEKELENVVGGMSNIITVSPSRRKKGEESGKDFTLFDSLEKRNIFDQSKN